MRLDRYKDMDKEVAESSEEEMTAAEAEETAETVTPDDVTAEAEEPNAEAKEEPKRRFGRKSKVKKADKGEEVDLAKMKKKDLLEIMLAQSKEIDSLRAQVAELEAKLANREFEFEKIGSIAEASLAVTDIFKEAEKAAMIYLNNIRRSYEKRSKQHSND